MTSLQKVLKASRLLQVRGMHYQMTNKPDRARRAFAASYRILDNFLGHPLHSEK